MLIKTSTLTAPTFRRVLLRWFDSHGRKDLPWQKNKTPYRVWISEIMLQQTQVSTVIPYFERFIEKFPDIETLANATEDMIFHFWAGLGYYHRARHLQSAAKKIYRESNGKFPNELNDLITLPGIGQSTAGAIRSIAFDKKAAILDGNVKRVLTRLHGITEWPGEKKVMAKLWSLAEKYTPDKRCGDYTQAIMDLGATLCIRGKPRCTECPLEKYCFARANGIEKTLPLAKPRKILPIREATLLVLQNDQQIFLEKRPPTGIWSGLWSLPEITGKASPSEIQKICKQRFNLVVGDIEFAAGFRHTFSHFHLDIVPALIKVRQSRRKIVADAQQIWYNLKKSQMVGLPAPVKLLLSKLETLT